MELNRKDDYHIIKKEDKEGSSDAEPSSPILEKLFEDYKALSANVNLTGRYNNLWIVPCQNTLPLRFTTSSPVTM